VAQQSNERQMAQWLKFIVLAITDLIFEHCKDQVIIVVCRKEQQMVPGVDCAAPCVLGA